MFIALLGDNSDANIVLSVLMIQCAAFANVAFFSLLSNADAFFFSSRRVFSSVTRFYSVDKRAWENRRLSNKRGTVFVLYLMMISSRFEEEEDGIIPVFATSSSVAVSQFISVVSVPL